MATDNIDMLRTSTDYRAMLPYWQRVQAILGGVDTMRAAGSAFLPAFPSETASNHAYRVKNSKFTNVFGDIVGNLAAKPFTKEVALRDATPATTALVEDIDGAGNHLHVFASATFFYGLADAVSWVLVDYPVTRENATRADEQRAGVRPYFVRINALDMLEVHSAMIDGKEQFTYARFRMVGVERNAVGDEVAVTTVREFVRPELAREEGADPFAPPVYSMPEFTDYEQKAGSPTWDEVASGVLTIGVIPLVAFAPGMRIDGTWQFHPPMRAVAELQIEHYQQETDLKHAKQLTAFPMFAGNGIPQPKDAQGQPIKLIVGPSAVLYSPPAMDGTHGEWKVLEISATSLKFLAEEVKTTEQQMRELGRSPLLAGSAGITQVAAALASQQASSALQAWALQEKDALEQLFVYACMWLGETKHPSVYVNTDFQINLGDDKAPELLDKMQARGVLSRATLYDELKRRGTLSPEFTKEDEEKKLLDETPGDDGGEIVA